MKRNCDRNTVPRLASEIRERKEFSKKPNRDTGNMQAHQKMGEGRTSEDPLVKAAMEEMVLSKRKKKKVKGKGLILCRKKKGGGQTLCVWSRESAPTQKKR